MATSVELAKINSFKQNLNNALSKSLQSYLGDEKEAIKFMSSASFLVQKTPKLLEVDQSSLFNALIQALELKLPVHTGEVYILPYGKQAQFQLGYQGIVTLLYRSGVASIKAEIVHLNDDFSIENGTIHHKVDFKKSTKERGEAIGAYVIVKLKSGEEISKYMHKDDILKFRDYSISYKGNGKTYSPWNEKNDPELNMWKKTVLKQLAKYLPKNETIVKALDYDNQYSVIANSEVNTINSNIADELVEGFEVEETKEVSEK